MYLEISAVNIPSIIQNTSEEINEAVTKVSANSCGAIPPELSG